MIGWMILFTGEIKIRPVGFERFVHCFIPPRVPGYVWFIETRINNHVFCNALKSFPFQFIVQRLNEKWYKLQRQQSESQVKTIFS